MGEATVQLAMPGRVGDGPAQVSASGRPSTLPSSTPPARTRSGQRVRRSAIWAAAKVGSKNRA
jgi:hypothetical protein